VRNGAQAFGEAIGAGEDAKHAGQRFGARGVDGADARMRVRGAHHHRIGLAVETEIVAEAAAAGGEAGVLLAHDRLADETEALRSRRLVEVRHRHAREISTIAGGRRRMIHPAGPEAPSFPRQMQIYVA
jgi:hypothetical protein